MGRLLIFLFLVSSLNAQNLKSNFYFELSGIANGENNPFWLTHNNFYTVGEETQFVGEIGAQGTYGLNENSSINAGMSLYYRDGVRTDEFQRKELFVDFTNRWLKATVGSRKIVDLTEGLSASSKNFLFSGNSRPLPGILFEANNPIKLFDGLSLDWGIGHYLLNDDRYVKDPYVHYKRVGVKWQWNERNSFMAKLQHFVQWGGTSPDFGKLDSDFGAFVDVFTASQPENNPIPGEAVNALGNHLGSYLFDYQNKGDWGWISIYHEHPFEDGSGSGFSNFPDGIWGAHFKPKKQNIIGAVLYEYIDTSNQSASKIGYDNYFSNSVYRSGWTYEGNVIGMPFILNNPELVIGPDNSAIISNRVIAHHLGMSGTYRKFDWMLKSSWVTNLVNYINPVLPELKSWYTYLGLTYHTSKYGIVQLNSGVDLGDHLSNQWAVGLKYGYKI